MKTKRETIYIFKQYGLEKIICGPSDKKTRDKLIKFTSPRKRTAALPENCRVVNPSFIALNTISHEYSVVTIIDRDKLDAIHYHISRIEPEKLNEIQTQKLNYFISDLNNRNSSIQDATPYNVYKFHENELWVETYFVGNYKSIWFLFDKKYSDHHVVYFFETPTAFERHLKKLLRCVRIDCSLVFDPLTGEIINKHGLAFKVTFETPRIYTDSNSFLMLSDN